MIVALIQQLRVRQWTKNTVLFAGVIFAHQFTELPDLLRAFAGFAAFCLLASAIYILNDLVDLEVKVVGHAAQHFPGLDDFVVNGNFVGLPENGRDHVRGQGFVFGFGFSDDPRQKAFQPPGGGDVAVGTCIGSKPVCPFAQL